MLLLLEGLGWGIDAWDMNRVGLPKVWIGRGCA